MLENENLNEQQNPQLNIAAVSHSCICCEKEIKKLNGLLKDKDWEGMWDGGIVEKISAGYGSLLDGDMYILAICDDCVKLKQLKYVGNYEGTNYLYTIRYCPGYEGYIPDNLGHEICKFCGTISYYH